MPSDARSYGTQRSESGQVDAFASLKDRITGTMTSRRSAVGPTHPFATFVLGLVLWPILLSDYSPFNGLKEHSASSKAFMLRSRFSSHVFFDGSSSKSLPITQVKAHSMGFTALENVYLRDGIWYILSSNSSGDIPFLGYIDCGEVSVPDHIDLSVEQLHRHIRLVHPDDAVQTLKASAAAVVDGLTWAIKEKFFVHHFGHFAPELFLGSWFTTVAGWPKATPLPQRIFYPLENDAFWRDGPGLNAFLVRSAFPAISFMHLADWDNLAAAGPVLMFEKLVIVDRQAGHRSPANAAANKMVAQLPVDFPQIVKAGDGSWWEPIRQNLIASVHASLPPSGPATHKRTITYISRQSASRRKLRAADHTRLVGAMDALAERKGIEVNVVELEGLSPAEQIRIASETDIFVSLHGNGLSMLLFGRPTPHLAAVIEILLPDSWARDFELPASMLGKQHFGIWDDVVLRGEEMEPAMKMPDGFHGSDIPVTAMTVVKLLECILDGKTPPAHKSKLS